MRTMRLREVAGVWARVGVSDPCQVEQHSAGDCDDRTQGAAKSPPTRGRIRLEAMTKQCGVCCRHQLSSKGRDTFGVGWEEEPEARMCQSKRKRSMMFLRSQDVWHKQQKLFWADHQCRGVVKMSVRAKIQAQTDVDESMSDMESVESVAGSSARDTLWDSIIVRTREIERCLILRGPFPPCRWRLGPGPRTDARQTAPTSRLREALKGPKRSGNRHKRARQVRLVLPNRDSGGVVPGRALNCTCFDFRVQGWVVLALGNRGEGNRGEGEHGRGGRRREGEEEGRGRVKGEARSPPTTVPRKCSTQSRPIAGQEKRIVQISAILSAWRQRQHLRAHVCWC